MQRALRTAAALAALALVMPALPVDAATWTEQSGAGAQPWQSITSSSDGTKLAAVVYNGYPYTSSDSGATWTQRTHAGSRIWTSITASSDGTKMAATVYGGYVYTSTDGGATWTERTSAGSRNWLTIASSADGSRLIAAGYNTYISTSVDGGMTWTQQTSSGARYWYSIAISADGSRVVATVPSGYVYTSVDSGATWTQQNNAGIRAWKDVSSSSDGTKLAAVVYNGYVYTSADSGITWLERAGAGAKRWTSVSSSADGSKLVIGAEQSGADVYKVYTSADSGATWTEQPSLARAGPNPYWLAKDITSSADGNKVAVVNQGPGYIYTADMGYISPPLTPTLGGPTTGVINTTYTFNLTATDPDDDTIRYALDWNGDGTIDEYTPASGYVASGTQGQATHSFTTAGTYTWKARAEDSEAATSAWASYTTTIGNPAPTVLLTASADTYHAGVDGPITLTWSSSYASSCTGTNFSTGGATSGTTQVTPTQTTTYTVSCAGSGGTTESSQTITYIPLSCTPSYTCAGDDIRYTDASCAVSTIATCTTPAFCSAGVSTCSYPPMTVASFGSYSGHLQARPTLVRGGGTARLFWNVENAASCTVSSDTTSDTWTLTSSGASGQQTGPILSRTTYTILCTAHPGGTPASLIERATVSTLPVFLEL